MPVRLAATAGIPGSNTTVPPVTLPEAKELIMDRRSVLGFLSAGAAAGCALLVSAGSQPTAESQPGAATKRGLPPLKITDVTTILTAPNRIRLVIVKVATSEPGLYGVGCATFTQRASLVQTAVEKYLKPFLIGRNVDEIEDIWQSSYVSSYWRNGPVLFNAMSGVDMALWDIKGKRANMPVYQLLGGKCRFAAACYVHVRGRDYKEVEDNARAAMARGYRHVRVQVSVPGMATYGASGDTARTEPTTPAQPARLSPKRSGSQSPYLRMLPKLFEHLRTTLGDEVELLHDVHERISPAQALGLCKELGKVSPLFPGRPPAPGRKRSFPADPAAVERSPGDGRAVQHPARVSAAHRRAADRLHPDSHLADRRAFDGSQGGRSLRVFWRQDSLAWPG